MNKKLLFAGVLSASVLTLSITAPAAATNSNKKIPSHKVGICHATGSKTNPYVFIVVDKHAAEAHTKHQDRRDVIGVTSKDKCPKGEVKSDTTKGGKGGGDTLGTSTENKGGTPTTLPETGAAAGLSALIGIPAMALAGRAYLRSRLSR